LDQQLSAASAAAVAALCDGHKANQLSFASYGALPALVSMLSAPGQSFIGINLPLHAANAIAALAANGDLQGPLASAHGAVVPLISALALGSLQMREHCARALMRLVSGNAYAKRAVLTNGGVEALAGFLITAETRESTHYAGRALVHVASRYAEGEQRVKQVLFRCLFSWPCVLDFMVPGHPALIRRRLMLSQVPAVLATLASIPLEPLRQCIAYELSPLPASTSAVREGGYDDDDEEEEDGEEEEEEEDEEGQFTHGHGNGLTK
jgi:hypothetical protein